ncbi:M4 family metallopeptidase [Nonomuraea sp. B12E4]|uniref:M4 family metallopeptidase n=1 Tax=Nonomuraea sp. B12E4 TaxID=3153564 RepID=UPI00325D567F
MEPRSGTRAPAEVSGLDEPAASADIVKAAKDHLAGARYHLDPADLTLVQTVADGQDETVRLAQRHRNLPVFGAQYLVHFRKDGDQRKVTGAGGRFLTDLDVNTTPKISVRTAGEIARNLLVKDLAVRQSVTVAPGGLIIVPRGKGRLAWQVTLTGDDPAKKRPVVFDAYVDAHSGEALFAVDRLRYEGAVEGSGRLVRGDTVRLPAYQRADGVYELRDRSRPMWNGTTGEIVTYDGEGGDLSEYESHDPARSATPVFGPEHTGSGAVDAHWGAGKVYEFYRRLGRESLDGRGGTIQSVVNVTQGGWPFDGAMWDGTKMVYGGGTGDSPSFASSLDIVGHEMTHGVIQHSANLVYLGQSGAMNEALADYFGNAIQVDAFGIPMTDPDASLLGEDRCRPQPPSECADRDLDDDRNTAEDYLGTTTAIDAGGVHLNSTIFSGALWDVRERLGARFDRVVYKALTEYMTPLDGFTDGRRAIESAARAARLSTLDRHVIASAFGRHGVAAGWESLIPTDSSVVVNGLTTAIHPPGLAQGRYVAMNAASNGDIPYAIITGEVGGSAPVTLSDTGVINGLPATDGERGVWAAIDFATGVQQIRSRPLDLSAPSTLVHETTANVLSTAVGGDTVAWTAVDPGNGEIEVWVKKGGADPVNLTAEDNVQGDSPSIAGGRLAYLRIRFAEDGPHSAPVVYDLAGGEQVQLPEGPWIGRSPLYSSVVSLTSKHVLWLYDADLDGRRGLMRANLDGTGLTPILPDGPGAPAAYFLDASDETATVSVFPEGGLTNEGLPKLFQVPVSGGAFTRYSCNRGEQYLFSSGTGPQVIWLDGTAGDTDLVTRDGPAGTC